MISDEQLRSARELDKMLTKLSITWDAFKSKLISATFPGLEKLFDNVQNVLLDPKVISAAEELFSVIEDGFKSLAADEETTKLINNLAKLTGGAITVARWANKGVNYTVDKTEGAGGAIGTIVGTAETQGMSGVAQLFGLDLIADSIKRRFQDGQQYAPVDVVQNITIDGAKDPEAIGTEVVNKMAEAANGNARKQMVDTRRNNTVM